MAFQYNATNIPPVSGNMPIPRGKYLLKIESATEKLSKKGDPMVTVDFKVAEGPFEGRKIRFHNVTFLPPDSKGAGMAIHFLKTIMEPFEGAIEIQPKNWIGKTLVGFVDQEPDFNGIPRNVVRDVVSIDGDSDVVPF